MAVETHDIVLHTIDGLRLTGDLAAPVGRPAMVGAVLCHPHPRFGGDRHNGVIEAIFTRLPTLGAAVVRFDFRGVGTSEGRHGDGVDERLDVAAAVETLASATDAPIWLVGYSFGAAVALDVTLPRPEGWVGIAPPLAMLATERLSASDHRPKHLLVPAHDQFSPPDATGRSTAAWRATTSTVVPTADHFLAGHLGMVADWVAGTLGLSERP